MLVSRVFCSLVVRQQPPTSLTRSILSQALPPPSGKETSDSEAQQKTGKYFIKYLVVLVDFSTNQFIDIYPKSLEVRVKLGWVGRQETLAKKILNLFQLFICDIC